ncbi:MAG: ribonuclease HII [archaeon]
MTTKIGIDDAGRGPVIGPMILAGVLTESEEQEIELKELEVKDSKLLLPAKRKRISDKVKEKFKYFIVRTEPKEIDECTNLNTLEALKAGMIINKLLQETKTKEKINVKVDCPSVNIKAWTETLLGFIEEKSRISVSCEHKADFNHPIVSAASIIAKEEREDEVKRLKLEYRVDFGSGYPADPSTVEFLEKNVKDPKYKNMIRFSWSTVKKLLDENTGKQKKLEF